MTGFAYLLLGLALIAAWHQSMGWLIVIGLVAYFRRTL